MSHDAAMKAISGGAERVFSRFRSFSETHENEPTELLIENKIWFSGMDSLDDIFEGRPIFKWDSRLPTIQSLIDMARRRERGWGERQRREFAERTLSRMNDSFESAVIKGWMEVDGLRMYQSSSVCCFFRNPCVQRHWADYAGRGSGYALVFDFAQPWLMESSKGDKPSKMVPMPVKYISGFDRPCVSMSLAHDLRDTSFDPIEKGLLTKSDQWANQAEYRIVRLAIPGGHVSFPDSSLVAILLGYNISADNLANLRALNSQRKRPLPLFHGKPSTKDFGIDLHPVAM